MYQYFVKVPASETKPLEPGTKRKLSCSALLQVVPTVYQDIRSRVLKTNQFSVTEHVKDVDLASGRNLPGVFFFYDINPIQVQASEAVQGCCDGLISRFYAGSLHGGEAYVHAVPDERVCHCWWSLHRIGVGTARVAAIAWTIFF